MARQDQSPARRSTQNLSIHSGNSQAPERNWDADAPEPDQTASTSQVAPGSGIEVFYDLTLPEVINDIGKEVQSSALSSNSTARRFPRRKLWIFIAATLVLVISVGFGAGFGLPAKKPNNSSFASKSDNPTSSNLTTSAASSTATTTSALLSKHKILNDTSFAAVTTSDGNRHVFFQEVSGLIRQSIYKNSTWSAEVTYTVVADAKTHSPMSASLVPLNSSTDGTEQIHLFYINTDNHIGRLVFHFGRGYWDEEKDWILPGNITDIKTDVNSRALSATFSAYLGQENSVRGAQIIDGWHNSAYNDSSFHLLYEAANGNATWLAGLNYSDTGKLEWVDLGIEGFRPHNHISGPLSSSMSPVTTSHYSIEAIVFQAADARAVPASLYNGTIKHESITFPLRLSNKSSSFDFDFTQSCVTYGSNLESRTYMFWVNGSELASPNSIYATPPVTPFPFTRLASTASIGSTSLYLYHQINESTIAEDQYDTTVGYWTSTYITIKTS